MMRYYELATLSTVIFGAGKAGPAIRDYLSGSEAAGRLLGAWYADIGRLNEIFILRCFDDHTQLLAERDRIRRSPDPFGCGGLLTGIEMDSYVPFDFVPQAEPGEYGPFYEIRTYRMKLDGLVPTEAKWRAAVPGRLAYSPLSVAMYSIDGAPRLTHIWPYRSLDERQVLRARSVAEKAWPPQGGPDWLTPDMYSAIALPFDFSPLR